MSFIKEKVFLKIYLIPVLGLNIENTKSPIFFVKDRILEHQTQSRIMRIKISNLRLSKYKRSKWECRIRKIHFFFYQILQVSPSSKLTLKTKNILSIFGIRCFGFQSNNFQYCSFWSFRNPLLIFRSFSIRWLSILWFSDLKTSMFCFRIFVLIIVISIFYNWINCSILKIFM